MSARRPRVAWASKRCRPCGGMVKVRIVDTQCPRCGEPFRARARECLVCGYEGPTCQCVTVRGEAPTYERPPEPERQLTIEDALS